MKQLLLVVCLIGQTWSAALAQEGGLGLPVRPTDGVVLTLQNAASASEGSNFLKVFVGPPDACCVSKTPMAGTYTHDGRVLTFNPAFDFIAEQVYTVQVLDGTARLARFQIAATDKVLAPEVVAIYPSGPVIPENTLRFYVQFSTPMMPHKADEFITLLDANGAPDREAFMSFSQELWNEDRTRLTLLMDPGRIKRGVAQNLTLGPALEQGARYAIVVEDGWPSAVSGQTGSRFEHSFTVSSALRRLPDVDLWQFQAPRVNTIEPLVISFDRPFDRQLVRSAITVFGEAGRRIDGTVSVEGYEETWRFQPDIPWSTSKIQIVVDARLEDVAGNNFRDLLDHSVETDLQALDHQTVLLELRPNL